MKLREVHLAILRALDQPFGHDVWLYTQEIGKRMPNHLMLPHLNRALSSRRKLFIANTLGTLLGFLKREGYVLQLPGNHRPGQASLWKLGPRSDELKEQGIL